MVELEDGENKFIETQIGIIESQENGFLGQFFLTLRRGYEVLDADEMIAMSP